MRIIWLLFFGMYGTQVVAQQPLGMKDLIDRNFQLAALQYKLLYSHTPADKMPRYFANDSLTTSNTSWWTSGFFPGSLWLIYEATADEGIKQMAEQRLQLQEPMQRYTGNHDIGFMIYCSFGTAYRITGNPKYKQVIDTAAVYQLERYRPVVKTIQSWNSSNRYTCPVIIDNMMNLEQLLWVSQQSGNSRFSEVAITHANTTLRNHYRPDHSSYHVVDYDLQSGAILQKVTHQGLSNESAWARGQAWGLYGYTVMYRFTKNKIYLQQADAIAKFMTEHPNLPEDGIPYWDFNAKPGADTYRDASAGAIMASALLELAQYSAAAKKYRAMAEKILRSLSSPRYLAAPNELGGFLLKHSVGSIPHNSEVDVPLTYADYYFLEAMKRYKEWVIQDK